MWGSPSLTVGKPPYVPTVDTARCHATARTPRALRDSASPYDHRIPSQQHFLGQHALDLVEPQGGQEYITHGRS